MTVVWLLIFVGPVLIALGILANLIRNYWREPVHLKGRVYMHRRHAASWALLMVMDGVLIVGDILNFLVFGAAWWSTLPAALVIGCTAWFAYSQRQLSLRLMRAAEDAELSRARIPDSPEGI